MNWEQFGVDKRLVNVLETDFQFFTPTPVQQKCIGEFLSSKDVIVQAPTGSGKTLAYALPVVEILLRRSKKWEKFEVGALIVVPNRELALQIYDVFRRLLAEIPLNLISFVGGRRIDADFDELFEKGCNIIVATPGRLEDLLSNAKGVEKQFSSRFKSLEILIFDEADRLMDVGFERSITAVLANLPKQRRTGLFSATQTKFLEDLLKTGLRNPFKITVNDDVIRSSTKSAKLKTPSTLKNYYCVLEPLKKFAALYKFLLKHQKEKLLIFMSTCACVDYFAEFLTKNEKFSTAKILSIHRKKKTKRAEIFQHFGSAEHAVLICTDVMARGIDIPSIDWVIQFDPPRNVSWFVHRCGRTARCGRRGKALLFLTPTETSYVDFVEKNQKVSLKRTNFNCSESYALKLMENFRKKALKDRSFLEKGTKAFVSYVQSYAKHDCKIVCNISELDVVNVAHSFGLIRLPKMPEMRGRDLSAFRRLDVNTADIPYLDKKLEKTRRVRLEEHRKTKEIEKNKKTRNLENENKRKRTRKRDRESRRNFDAEDLDEIDNDYKLIKRLKKGKLTKNEFDDQFLM